MIRGVTFVVLAFALAACKTGPAPAGRAPEGFDLPYRYVDSPEQKRILLFYRNTGPHPVCLGPENWPDQGMVLNNGSQVWLEIQDRKYYLELAQDYCPGCNIKVEPGAERNDFLPYSSFKLPAELSESPKKLHFRPTGYNCR